MIDGKNTLQVRRFVVASKPRRAISKTCEERVVSAPVPEKDMEGGRSEHFDTEEGCRGHLER